MADTTGTPTSDDRSDLQLLRAVRDGDTTAYAVLYQRHATAARRLARTLDPRPSDVDELVAEAFARVLAALRAGAGPRAAFRTYLLTTLRNVFHDETRRSRRLDLVDDLSHHDPGEPFVDPAVRGLEHGMVARAFAALPERWRLVLWHTEVEGDTPATVARLLGVRPNTVSALAYRARERLRQNYLREHAATRTEAACRWTADRLGAYVRDRLAARDRTEVEDHLSGCRSCRLLFVELGDVNSGLGAILVPALVGAAAVGYATAGATTGSGGTGADGGTGSGAGGNSTGGSGGGRDAVGGDGGNPADRGTPGRGRARLRRHLRNPATRLAAAGAVLVLLVTVALALGGGSEPTAGPGRAAPPPAGPATPKESPTPTPDPDRGGTPTPDPAAGTPDDPGPTAGQPSGAADRPGTAESPGATGPGTTAPGSAGPLSVTLAPVGTLVRGRSTVLLMTVTNPVRSSAGAGGGRLPGTYRAGPADRTGPLSARITLPNGIRLRTGSAGDGWTCAAGSPGTCRRGPLAAASTSTAYLPVTVAGTARGGTVRLSLDTPGTPRRTATLRLDVADTGLATVYAGTVPARLTAAGNALLSCLDLDLTCRAARAGRPALGRVDNGDYLMARYAAPDAPAGAPRGGMVSGASVRLTGRVLWAGLYWAGTGRPPRTPTAYLRAPGSGRYTPLRADRVDTFPARLEGRHGYQAYVDVTRLARSGTWWVGVDRRAFSAGVGAFGGWSLLAVVTDGGPPRSVAVLDGALALRPGASVSTPLPGAAGAAAQIGFVGWETDRATTGDRLDLAGSPVDRGNPSNAAASRTDGTTAGWNTFGTDARVLRTRLPDDGPVQLTARTGRDAWLLGTLAISAEQP
ncbi:sigma-70 family RNA polymerase sigma factor [Plantactinospora sp. B5E13]|uniref:sigma-70 family RNA polymerase sigma factor n=1 Tax=Plantactinospora sp. B5E13 TaxID=3153758 RepID=UPI00325D950D